ncbi:GNAT family N-acetyltransferase [Photorhabdus sp. CRCIA-P01]|uniref:GNAT family N-acetyltransferase n=1 Tax=Photorhabdus sp. CRCIA-P01 TaxID=2019570 RepID=UPI000E59EA3F|nr:GNAT family N-acetyltransferase [Photorhabdus sp. CRCIA-P01]
MIVVLETDRLIMRAWREQDRLPFCHLNSNAEVMEYFPATLTAEQSNTMVDTIIQRFEQQEGWGLWASASCTCALPDSSIIALFPFLVFVTLMFYTIAA